MPRRGKEVGQQWRLPDTVRRQIGTMLMIDIPISQIVDELQVSLSTVYRIKSYLKDFGSVDLPYRRTPGRRPIITPEVLNFVLIALVEKPTMYLDEICLLVFDAFGVACSISTMSAALKEAQWTRKITRRRALEQSQDQRTAFEIRRSQWTIDELVSIDESGANERTGDRKYGFAPKGITPIQISPFHRSERYSILPALSAEGYVGEPIIYQGSITSGRFAAWLELEVLPNCNAFVEGQLTPKSILIMDNAQIHKTAEVDDVLQASGVRVEFIPPYSPDYNPIELEFSVIKSAIRQLQEHSAEFSDYGLFLRWILELKGGRHGRAQFKHCGYNEE